MAKVLKPRSQNVVIGNNNIVGNNFGNGTHLNIDSEEEYDVNDIHSLDSKDLLSHDKLKETIKRLKERNLYFDSYEDFVKDGRKDGVYIEERPDGSVSMSVYADTPQEAMDKLYDYGLISKEDCELFKSRFDHLEAQGVDVSKIRGGSLDVLRDDKLFEVYEQQMIEQYGQDIASPDVRVGQSQSIKDEDLLARLAEAELNSGIGPDVLVGKETDMEMEV